MNYDDLYLSDCLTELTFFSTCSTEPTMQKGASFPFKSTPSGNLKVQSNQVNIVKCHCCYL